jgi:3-dehydroquinate synthase
LGADRYLELMGHDKKVEGGKLRFILLRAIGEAYLTADVGRDALLQALAASVSHD